MKNSEDSSNYMLMLMFNTIHRAREGERKRESIIRLHLVDEVLRLETRGQQLARVIFLPDLGNVHFRMRKGGGTMA